MPWFRTTAELSWLLVGAISRKRTPATVAATVKKATTSRLRGSAAAPKNSAKVATEIKTMPDSNFSLHHTRRRYESAADSYLNSPD